MCCASGSDSEFVEIAETARWRPRPVAACREASSE